MLRDKSTEKQKPGKNITLLAEVIIGLIIMIIKMMMLIVTGLTINNNMVTVFSERELTFTYVRYMSSSVRLSSVVSLSVVCNVRAPYSGD